MKIAPCSCPSCTLFMFVRRTPAVLATTLGSGFALGFLLKGIL